MSVSLSSAAGLPPECAPSVLSGLDGVGYTRAHVEPPPSSYGSKADEESCFP